MGLVAHDAGARLPPVRLGATNRIPIQRGLGSSSSAAVAGVLLAATLLDLPLARDQQGVLRVAARLEGHPDNAAAAVFGGLVVTVSDAPSIRLDPPPSLAPAVLVPRSVRLSTREARAALGTLVPRGDAVYNLGHAAMAIVALTSRPDLLRVALRDRLHQDARLALAPEAAEVFELVASAGVPVCVSGAGPSLLAFETDGRSVPELAPDMAGSWQVLRPRISTTGAVVTSDG
jgi:homoserine kinase